MIADRGQLGPDDFDALADLFLSEQPSVRRAPAPNSAVDEPPTNEPAPAPSASSTLPIIEVVVLGHIPAMAASWASQYARLRSEAVGEPVAMLRLGDKRARVELFGAPFQSPSHDVATAIAAARVVTRHMIVLPAPGTPAESGALVERGSAVTLMTTPDEAGLVAAYGELKRLAPVCEAGSAGGPKPLRIVAVGEGAPKAQPACRRLQDAASSFLHVDMESSVFIERLSGGVAPVTLFDGAWLGTLEELIDNLQRPTPAAAPQVPNQRVVGVTLPEPPLVEPTAPEAHNMSRIAPTPAPAAPSFTSPAREREESARFAPVAAAPVRAAVHETAGSAARLVPGLSIINARCPHAPEVELAFDAEGRLHAVAMPAPGHEPAAVHALVVAAGWAHANRGLLGQVASRRAHDAATCMHLISTNPAACRSLLDSAVKVHACVQVQAPLPAGSMVATPMN